MKNTKRIYVDHKLIRNDINFGKKTNIKSLFGIDDFIDKYDRDFIVKNDTKNKVENSKVIDDDSFSLKNNFDINKKIISNLDSNKNIESANDDVSTLNNESMISEKQIYSNNENTNNKKENKEFSFYVNNDSTEIKDNEYFGIETKESEIVKYDSIDEILIENEEINDLEFNHDNNENKKRKKGKILPWMLAATTFLLAGTTTATVILSVFPKNGIEQSQSNTIDKNVTFELKHNRSNLINETNKKLETQLLDTTIDMDKYFFGMNLDNKNSSKLDISEKNSLLEKINNVFNSDKNNFLYNVVDTLIINNVNKIASNFYGMNAINNKETPIKNVSVSNYIASDIFSINGFFEMEFSFSINGNNKDNSKNRYAIKFKDNDKLNGKSYVEITNKTDKNNEIKEIKEIVDIYSEYLLQNEYIKRNGIKSYIDINPFTKADDILTNINLPNSLKQYNNYASSNYFYQLMKSKSISNYQTVKNIFDANKDSIDQNISNGVNKLSSIISQESSQIKNIFTFLGIEDLLQKNKNITSIKVNDIKMSNFVSLSTGESKNKISGSLFTNISYKTNDGLNKNYYSYIFIEPQVVKNNLSVTYSITRSEDNVNFNSFEKKNWDIAWTPIEILVKMEFSKNNTIDGSSQSKPSIDLKTEIEKIAISANDSWFDNIIRYLKDNNFENYYVQNKLDKNLLEFNEFGLQHRIYVKTFLIDSPYAFSPNKLEEQIKSYLMYYFLDEINTIDESLGEQSKGSYSSSNKFIKNVNIDSINWTGLLFDNKNKNSLNYEFKISYSYMSKENKKINVTKIITASNDNFDNVNLINHYMPTFTIKETIKEDSNIKETLNYKEKIDISKNMDSFIIKSAIRFSKNK